jgi:hypothetical protein
MVRSPGSDQDKDSAPRRFEATVHPGAVEVALATVADLDLDRVPDPRGDVRVVVTADEVAELLGRGFEVRLHRVVETRPLSPGLVSGDEDAARWLEERVAGIPRGEA